MAVSDSSVSVDTIAAFKMN